MLRPQEVHVLNLRAGISGLELGQKVEQLKAIWEEYHPKLALVHGGTMMFASATPT